MACLTCSHTMQRVNSGGNPCVFWCPRCGTIESESPISGAENTRSEWNEPKIVHRAFTLCEAASGTFDNPQALESAIASVRECCDNPVQETPTSLGSDL